MLDKSFFHVGIVVPRLEEALDHLGATLGLRWGAVTETELPFEGADGTRAAVPLRMVYSVEAPYVEVIEEVRGSPWECNPCSNLHHIGFWADGLAACHDHLLGSACPLEAAGYAGDVVPAMFAYHRDPLGVRVELVDAAARPSIEAALAGGRALGAR
ncbi:MAG TPA: VOC family protein [Acidimicrobiales bacterium]|nr:VOC family protein [Acidimicrobiales bacterium]